jgi:hypothetical protein
VNGLMELGPMTRDVDVMGKTLTLRPISTREVIMLLAKFPDIAEFLDPRVDRTVTVVKIGPLAVAHLIACATGELDRPEAIEAAMGLGVGKMMEVLESIFEITFEDGVAPFMMRIKRLLGSIPTLESAQESSAPWSASLVGDEPRRPRLVRARDN